MNLRLKVFLSVGITLLVIFFAVYSVLTKSLSADFRELEEESVNKNVARLSDAFNNRISDLTVKVSDWGQWDDTYNFVQDENPDFVETNLQEEALELLQIQFIVITDETGKILVKKQVDENGEATEFSQNFEQFIETHPELTHHESTQNSHAAVVSLPEGTVVTVARAITSSDGTAPVEGTIMFAFFVDEAVVQKLSELTHLNIEFKTYQEALQDPEFALAAQNLQEEGTVFIQSPNENDTVIYGYALKKDMDNGKALIMRAELDRTIYLRGQEGIRLFTKIMAIAGIVIIGMMLLLFEYLVLRRLFRLGKAVEEVNQNHNAAATILFPGKDEFAQLAKRINVMLLSLHDLEAKKTESEKEFLTLMEKKNNELLHKVSETEKTKAAILNLLEDIQEEKEKTESILQFLESINEAVYATDTERKIIFINPAAAAIIGESPEKILGTHTSEHFFFEISEGDSLERTFPIKEVLSHKAPLSFPDHTFIIKGNQRLPVAGTAAPIFDDKDNLVGAIVVFQDITEKYELEQMKDNFLSVAAHQLRTPLGSMRWSMELLLNGDLGKITKDAKEVVTQLYENSQRMLTLVNDLLDVSRIDQKRGLEESKSVDLKALMNAIIKTLTGEAEKYSVTISFNCKGVLPPVMAAEQHLYEAFENMLDNAIKYSKPGGTVSILMEEKGGGIHIEIKDAGIGIPEADQQKLFSRFFRASNAILKETSGSGLGLSVVKSYLEEAGATIHFESAENVGTTFFIDFPASALAKSQAKKA